MQPPDAHPIVMSTSAAVAVNLADEGVPVRAIARSLKVPSEDVYNLLTEAIQQGRIIELPKDDWPPGAGRNTRTQLQRDILGLDDGVLYTACSDLYKLTRLQSVVFLTLLRRTQATKAQLHNAIENNRNEPADPTDQKMVDVVICHIRRKIKQHATANGIVAPEIRTTWGVGYGLNAIDRDKIMALLAEVLKDVE